MPCQCINDYILSLHPLNTPNNNPHPNNPHPNPTHPSPPHRHPPLTRTSRD